MAKILVKPNEQRGVECAVSSSHFPWGSSVRAIILAVIALFSAAYIHAASFREVPAPTFGQIVPQKAAPIDQPPPRDELVYKDGDRVRGHFLEKDGDTLVFQSERFGLLKVPAAQAKVILAKPSPAVAASEAKSDKKGEVAVERWPFSPLALAAALKDFFGAWHGRFTMSAEMMKDSSEHNSGTADALLQRKWTNDEVQLTARYDYATLDSTVSSTDMIKGAGVWRHDLPHKLFSVYRPTLEWNRAYYINGVPADYVLLQQEVGAGITLLNTTSRKFRVGLSENLFDTWGTTDGSHISQTVESVFSEVEAKLPWRIVVTDRGVWYYSFQNNTDGWENRFELSKKLTETLTMGLRHEVRHNNPDVRSADYRRLRLLFGFDF
ncbi:MAG: hypothetical protein ABIZ04_14100 [Opitutus sp.]